MDENPASTDLMLDEMDQITVFLSEFAAKAAFMMKDRDEDGFLDLVMRSSVEIYDYKRGKPLETDLKVIRDAESGLYSTKNGGWRVV